jgi:quercetin dioxygenase-like cupin family protein
MTKPYHVVPNILDLSFAGGRPTTVIQQDEASKVVLLQFAAGDGLPVHSTNSAAMIYMLEGTASLQLGEDTVVVTAGAFVHMPPALPHAILAQTAIRFLLIRLLQLHSG